MRSAWVAAVSAQVQADGSILQPCPALHSSAVDFVFAIQVPLSASYCIATHLSV
jgi:hypothetical protein